MNKKPFEYYKKNIEKYAHENNLTIDRAMFNSIYNEIQQYDIIDDYLNINCVNCEKCICCKNCSNCTDCSCCINCDNCTNSLSIVNCDNCKNCSNCSQCADCDESNELYKCINVKSSSKMRVCCNCYNCYNCRKCNNLINRSDISGEFEKLTNKKPLEYYIQNIEKYSRDINYEFINKIYNEIQEYDNVDDYLNINCKNCENCICCVDCIDCINCEYCEKCNKCFDCYNRYDCETSNNLFSCTDSQKYDYNCIDYYKVNSKDLHPQTSLINKLNTIKNRKIEMRLKRINDLKKRNRRLKIFTKTVK